jgi:hypothetical protein
MCDYHRTFPASLVPHLLTPSSEHLDIAVANDDSVEVPDSEPDIFCHRYIWVLNAHTDYSNDLPLHSVLPSETDRKVSRMHLRSLNLVCRRNGGGLFVCDP